MDDYDHLDLDAVTFAPVEHITRRLALLTLEEAHDLLGLLQAVAQEGAPCRRRRTGWRGRSPSASRRREDAQLSGGTSTGAQAGRADGGESVCRDTAEIWRCPAGGYGRGVGPGAASTGSDRGLPPVHRWPVPRTCPARGSAGRPLSQAAVSHPAKARYT
ncbi:DUF6417 family protein [Streptomyces sp. NPDC002088]|uniref:DUF6417 family protein n=1 Tax=Streptomyces sp. NPDC002088 TaxID=3154665 RepID=UPI0033187DF3